MEESPLLTEIGKRIRERRKALGITQAQMSYSCDTDPSYIRKIESGKVNLSVERLAVLSRAIGISMSELLEGL